jgi:hypothetical protein
MIHKPSCPEHRNVSASHAGCSRLPRSCGGQSVVGQLIVVWQHEIESELGSLRFANLRVETNGDHHVFKVEIHWSEWSELLLECDAS